MGQVGLQLELSDEKSTKWTTWLFCLVLAAAIHWLLFCADIPWTLPKAPPPVEVQNIDPAKLNQIRKQWRDKGLLLDRDKNRPSDKTAPPNARYQSDRNIRVEKEQKARDTAVLPQTGKPHGSEHPKTGSKKNTAPVKKKSYSKLGNLGVPFNLAKNTTPDELAQAPLGGHQSIVDDTVPLGSENLLNAEESVFYSFYERIYQSVAPIWGSLVREIPHHNPISTGEYTTILEIVLDRNGNLLEVNRAQNSGNSALDDAAEKAWRRVKQFPNPPLGLLNNNNVVRMRWYFRFSLSDRPNLQFAHPQKRY